MTVSDRDNLVTHFDVQHCVTELTSGHSHQLKQLWHTSIADIYICFCAIAAQVNWTVLKLH